MDQGLNTTPEKIYAMACLIINKKGKILLLKRSPDKKFFPNEWALVGAAPLSKDDNMEIIAHQEMRDELGMDGIIIKKSDEIIFQANNLEWHFFPFLGQIGSENITLNNEHTEYAWVTKEDLGNYKLLPLFQQFIHKFLS